MAKDIKVLYRGFYINQENENSPKITICRDLL